MQDFSKSEKKRLRELAALAYKRDVSNSLSKLAAKFDEWKSGAVTALQLNEALHEYDRGESRDLWSRYDSNQFDIQVASAIVRGLLTDAEVGKEILTLLLTQIQFLKSEADGDR